MSVHRIANALARERKFEITVRSLSPRPADAVYHHEQLFRNWKKLRESRLLRTFFLPLLLNFLKWDGFDVIHTFGDDWFFFRRQAPSLRTFNGSAWFEFQSATTWKRKLAQLIIFPLELLSARLCTKVIAVGSRTEKIYRAHYRSRHSVDLRLFHPGEKTPFPSIVFVGTWHGRKRGHFLYSIFRDVILPAFPEAQLFMACDFAPSHPHVHLGVHLENQKLAQLYRQSWVFAFPSTYEGFGIPYLEAMASGTPIVTSPNEGAKDILGAAGIGILAEDEAFSRQLIDLLGNVEEREKLAKKGLIEVQNYSEPHLVEEHRAFYESVAKLRAAGG